MWLIKPRRDPGIRPDCLADQLRRHGRTRWLDIACGGRWDEGFDCLDRFPQHPRQPRADHRYFPIDLLAVAEAELDRLDRYDLVRIQHALQDFTWEDGQTVLRHCARLLTQGGYLVVTAPDLRINVAKYLGDGHRRWKSFAWWARLRIPKDAPASFYFSVFAHGVEPEPNKWCYDAAGLSYALERVGEFAAIRELRFDDALASYPFTHNRPEEDVCVIATRR